LRVCTARDGTRAVSRRRLFGSDKLQRTLHRAHWSGVEPEFGDCLADTVSAVPRPSIALLGLRAVQLNCAPSAKTWSESAAGSRSTVRHIVSKAIVPRTAVPQSLWAMSTRHDLAILRPRIHRNWSLRSWNDLAREMSGTRHRKVSYYLKSEFILKWTK